MFGSSSSITPELTFIPTQFHWAPPTIQEIRIRRRYRRDKVQVELLLMEEMAKRGFPNLDRLMSRIDRLQRELADFRNRVGQHPNLTRGQWRRYRQMERELGKNKEVQTKVEDLRGIVEVWVRNGVVSDEASSMVQV